MRQLRYGRILIPTVVLALIGGLQCTQRVTGPTADVSDFPNTLGSWWTYEVQTQQIAGGDTTISTDTVTTSIVSLVVMDDGVTEASVWRFDPYFIDIDESLPESLFVTSMDLDTQVEGDTVHFYRSDAISSRYHTVYIKRWEKPSGIVAYAVSCEVSRSQEQFTVIVPAGEFESAYTSGTFCPVVSIDIGTGVLQHIHISRTLFIQPRIGIVHIRQRRYDSEQGTIQHIWDLLDFHIESR